MADTEVIHKEMAPGTCSMIKVAIQTFEKHKVHNVEHGKLAGFEDMLIVKFQEKWYNLENGQLGTQVDNVADPLVESPEKVWRFFF